MIFVIGGLVTVGLTDIIYSPNGKNTTDIIPAPAYNLSSLPVKEFNYGSIMLGEIEEDEHTPTQILIGDVLIVCAQVFKESSLTNTCIGAKRDYAYACNCEASYGGEDEAGLQCAKGFDDVQAKEGSVDD